MTESGRPWFLIIGSQRSGTTLMRLVLECHTLIEGFDEWRSYRVLAGQLQPSGQKSLSALKVPQLTEQLSESVLRDDNALREGLPGIPNPYHGENLIFMVRDARDTVASMLNLDSWLTRSGDPVLEAKIAADPAFARKYAIQLESARVSPYPNIARAALIWRYKVDALAEYTAMGYPVLAMRYEDLVTEPKAQLIKVCDALSVSYEDALLHHPSMPHRDLRPNGLATGKTDPQRAIDDRAVGQWRSTFNESEVQEILRIAGPVQHSLYDE